MCFSCKKSPKWHYKVFYRLFHSETGLSYGKREENTSGATPSTIRTVVFKILASFHHLCSSENTQKQISIEKYTMKEWGVFRVDFIAFPTSRIDQNRFIR